MLENLKEHLQKFNTSPILFVGSGFSRRYLDLPTWENLLKEMVKRLSLTKPFEYYKSKANSSMPEVAKLIGDDFNDIWWENNLFEESRKNFQAEANSKYSPIKYEISKRILENTDFVNNDNIAQEIKLLKKINIDAIITTNWDTLCETLFPDFSKYVVQEELIFSELLSIGEIYKIHGCATQPNSLILTSDDYNDFENRNPYLAAKLLTLFAENPIIFIGYSIDDPNIQSILRSIIKCITKDKVEKLKDRFIFCQWQSEEIESQFLDSQLFISETIVPIKSIKLSSFIDLFTVLANHKRKLPIKVLKQMKGMIYDFVKTNDSKQKVYIPDSLENIENLHKAEFVYGMGLSNRLSEIGVKGIGLKDVLEDIIEEKTNWVSTTVARQCLPNLKGKFIPYFKRLLDANFLNSEGKINEEIEILEFSPEFINTVNNVKIEDFYPQANYIKHKEEINKKYNNINELIEGIEGNIFHQLIYIPLLSPNKIDLNILKSFLTENKELLHNSKLGSYYRKLICLYDFLKYKVRKS